MELKQADFTANEVANYAVVFNYHQNSESIRKRVRELVVEGLIEPTVVRECEVTSMKCQAFRVK